MASGGPSAGVSPRHASAVALSLSASDPFSAGTRAHACTSPRGPDSPGAPPETHQKENEVVDFAQVDTQEGGVVTGGLHIHEDFVGVAGGRSSSSAPAAEDLSTGAHTPGTYVTLREHAPVFLCVLQHTRCCLDCGDVADHPYCLVGARLLQRI